MLLSRFVPYAFPPHSYRLQHGYSKLGRTVRGRTLLSWRQISEKISRGERAGNVDDVEKLLSRQWLMPQPSTRISKISILDSRSTEKLSPESPTHRNSHGCFEQMRYVSAENLEASQQDDHPSFYIIRDDLLHPLLGGNKLRKLDALMPELERIGATDVVTCGGCQSAHTAALAFASAERGMSAHLLLRGERPAIPTGYNLLCGMYGQVTYIPRSEYADRGGMLSKYASKIAGSSGSVTWLEESETTAQTSVCTAAFQGLPGRNVEGGKNVVVVKEGAGDAIALLGLIRLVEYLSRPTVFDRVDPLHLVVDTGTGTTAVGVALAIALLGLPWKVTGVMLADSIENYERHKLRLISDFSSKYPFSSAGSLNLPLLWEQRWSPRKFGKVYPGEIETCQSIARHTGILLDPIYTLAGWESAVKLSVESKGSNKVVMLHTGGTLGLFGLAQRYPAQFS